MPFQGFVDEFTNSPVQPAFSTYLQLSITNLNPPVQPGAQTSPIQLDWANLDQSTANPFSQVVKVIFNDNAANTIKLPDATLSSVQQTILFANTTETAYNVVDFNNNEVTTVLSGQVWFIALTDNTANDGINTWFPEVFGGVNTPANAAALVGPGYGLLASNGLIVENNIVVYLNAADTPYTIQSTDRGHYLIWDGTGSYTINLPVTAALPSAFSNGFIFALATTKTAGPITINAPTGQTIDGQPFLIISADKSTFLVADGEFGWSSLGYEVTINSTVTINDVELIGGDINITLDQSTSIIQNFVNNQAGPSLDSNITFQTTIPQQYIMSNLVTNPDTVIATVLPNTINAVYTLASGETCSFFMDETIGLSPSSNKFFAANGSAENPIFQNIGAPATGSGIYFTSDTGFPAITQGGNKVIDFSYNSSENITTLSSTAAELEFTLNNNPIFFSSTLTSYSITTSGNSLTLGQIGAPQITLGNVGGNPAIKSANLGTSPLQIIASNLTLNGSTAIALSAPTTTITATTGTTVTTPLLNVVGNLDVSGTITGGGLPSLPISIANGGTGQITQPLAIKALSAYTAQGQMLYSADGTGTIGYIAPPSTYGKTLITTVNSAAQVPAWSGNSILQVKNYPVADQGTPLALVPYVEGENIGSAIVFTPTPGNLNGRLLILATIFDLAGDVSSPSIQLNVNSANITGISDQSILYGTVYSATVGGGSSAYTTIYTLTSANALTFQFICGIYNTPPPNNYFSKLLSLTITEFAGGPF